MEFSKLGISFILGWNPLSLRQESRREEVSEELANFDIVLLVGTRVRATPDTPITVQTMPKHWGLVAGWDPKKAGGVGRAAGVEIWFKKSKVPRHCLHHVIPGPAAGRTLEVRIISGRFDLTLFALYYPPKASGRAN